MSNLVNHARRELEILNEDPKLIEGLLKVVQAFADMGHSGGSASYAIGVLHELLRFKNLAPLTDDPEEWMFVGGEVPGIQPGIWQNMRRSEAFSNDGGKSYYLLSEVENGGAQKPLHTSVPKNAETVSETQ